VAGVPSRSRSGPQASPCTRPRAARAAWPERRAPRHRPG
jgi:hypothetical protein